MVAVVIPSMPKVLGSPCGRCYQILLEAQHVTRSAHRPSHKLIVLRCRLDPTVPVQTALAEGLWQANVKHLDDFGPEDRFTP